MGEDDQRPVVFPFQGVQRGHERASVRAVVERLAEGGDIVDEHHLRKIRHGCRLYPLQHIASWSFHVHLRTEEGGRKIRRLVAEGSCRSVISKSAYNTRFPLAAISLATCMAKMVLPMPDCPKMMQRSLSRTILGYRTTTVGSDLPLLTQSFMEDTGKPPASTACCSCNC